MDRLVLHVGTMKSGTTFLQNLLFSQADALRAQGVVVGGSEWKHHVFGARAMMGHEGFSEASWRDLLATLEGPGTGVVSTEHLASARPEHARAIIDSVGAPVHVVMTTRDLNRQIPAMWQETLKNGRTWRFSDYLAAVEHTCPSTYAGRPLLAPPPGSTFWRHQGIVRIARIWSEVADAFTLVTVPPAGAPSDVLLRRFAGVVGFDPEGLALGARVNESMGAASAEVLRRTNEFFEQRGMPFPAGRHLRKKILAQDVLPSRRSEEPPIGLPVPDWVRLHSRSQSEALAGMDIGVAGDLADLEPRDVPGVNPDLVDPAEINRAAVEALVGMMTPEVLRTMAADGVPVPDGLRDEQAGVGSLAP